MKKFITKALIFIIIPLLVALTADIIISNILKTSTALPAENEVWNDIYNSEISADIAILGSSRAWVHFDPKIIKDSMHVNCYNFGEDASNFIHQYLRYKEYRSHNQPPKRVIISVDYFTLHASSNGYPTTRFNPYMLWNIRMLNLVRSLNKDLKESDYLLPMTRYLKSWEVIKSLLKANKKPHSKTYNMVYELNEDNKFRKDGYRGMEIPWRNDAYKKVNITIGVNPAILQLFEDFTQELQHENIELYIV